ncbi:uncharacterized protein LOC125188379 isoform X5 [Salvia hispanica]|uniref:uncharacterized protein LOC125188379 isoform X5 n=1 Tax=Salvia hispanica TaxID=49212 RepID=UPI002009202A|nr:uncharacterized protein LOC125188379 isoform X5 [Salvia hispanica]
MAMNNTTTAYAGWEEVLFSTEKGRREVHYYLKRCGGGGRDLVVVGKEKSARNMPYHYKIRDNKLAPSILSGASGVKLRSRREVVDWLESIISDDQPNSSRQFGSSMDRDLDDDVIEDVMKQKLGRYKAESMWIGSSWMCRKRRSHYQSFCHNGAVISAQEFVYVLAEEGKRLVAYLDDMYEDIRGNKMVVVRWFHKIDEEIFRKSKRTVGESVGLKPNKRIRWSKESELYSKSPDNGESGVTSLQVISGTSLECKVGVKKGNKKEYGSCISLSARDNTPPPKSDKYFAVGSQVEVLSQDSGIRGCWFRALIIKKHRDKVKIQYRDVKDAVDESKNLEEWILASRIARPDAFGIRLSGRTTVRPTLSSEKGNISCAVTIGTVVDAWRHDGWWEGIVVKKESEDRFNVYFPDEKQEFTFHAGDLRHSNEWFDNTWQNIKQRLDVLSALYGSNKISDTKKDELPSFDNREIAAASLNEDALHQKVIKTGDPTPVRDGKMVVESQAFRDLTKDCLLGQLRWRSSGKRRRSRSPVKAGVEAAFAGFFVNSALKLDPDNCKSLRDSRFSSSVVPPMSNLVVSR